MSTIHPLEVTFYKAIKGFYYPMDPIIKQLVQENIKYIMY